MIRFERRDSSDRSRAAGVLIGIWTSGELNPCHEPPDASGRNLPSGPRVCRFPQLWRNVLKARDKEELMRIFANPQGFYANEMFAKKYLDLGVYLCENRPTVER